MCDRRIDREKTGRKIKKMRERVSEWGMLALISLIFARKWWK